MLYMTCSLIDLILLHSYHIHINNTNTCALQRMCYRYDTLELSSVLMCGSYLKYEQNEVQILFMALVC